MIRLASITPKPKPVIRRTTPTTAKPRATAPAPAKPAPKSAPAPGPNANTEEGKASWYQASYHSQDPWICAHKTLPMGTVVTVTAVASGKSITCHVGDRGPYVDGRVIDLSPEAFSHLAPTSSGVIAVRLNW